MKGSDQKAAVPQWGRLQEIGAEVGDTILSLGGAFDGKVVTEAMLSVWQQPDYAILRKAEDASPCPPANTTRGGQDG